MSLFDDSDDDLTLRTRRTSSSEYIPERSVAEMHDNAHDREVTLNTGTVLALFFALALVCAVFFGFGYSMGRKSAQPVAGEVDSAKTPASIPASDGPAISPANKPAPGSPATQPIPGYMTPSEANGNARTTSPSLQAASAPQKTAEPRSAVAALPAAEAKAAPVVHTPPPAAAASASTPAPNVSGSTYVQIAAVSHQEDADVLLSALKRRGYSVVQRSEPTDKLIHVQIGPFPNRKDAEGTRQKLLADGYNAFVK